MGDHGGHLADRSHGLDVQHFLVGAAQFAGLFLDAVFESVAQAMILVGSDCNWRLMMLNESASSPI